MKKAVVIGAGIGGLGAAVRLARLGYAVTVLEANDYAGGKLANNVLGGYRFDRGPSLFTMPFLVDEVLDDATEFEYEKLENICNYFFEDGTRLAASADRETFIARLAAAYNEDPNAVRAHLDKSRLLYDTTAEVFMYSSLHRAKTFLRGSTLRSALRLPTIGIHTTMHRANTARFRSPKTVQHFNRYATYNGSDPYTAPAVLNVIPHLEHHQGAFYPKGGMFSIPTAVRNAAERLGVVFHFNTPAREIVYVSKRVTGVRTDNATYPADLVVSNLDVYQTYRRLLPALPAPERILAQSKSLSGVSFNWGIRGTFPELDLHNIFFGNDYAAEFEHYFKHKNISPDPTVYINVTSKHTPEDAPAGCENWFILVNAPSNEGQDWDAIVADTRRAVLSKLSRMLGKDIEPLIEVEDVLEPRSIEARTGSYGGSLYGNASNSTFAAFMRHSNHNPRLRGLYHTGGSVHPGGGIPMSLLSAKIVGDMVSDGKNV